MDIAHDVPIEVLVCVFTRVSVRDLVAIAKTCRRFRAAVLVDQIWQDICRKDHNVYSCDGWNVSSYRELYTTVLYKYGYLIGTWKRNIPRYGGLVQITAEKGRLLAVDCRAPYQPNILNPLRPKELFSISIDRGKISTKCLAGWEADKEHYGTIKIHDSKDDEAFQMEFKCLASENHDVRPENFGIQNSIQQWLKEEYDDENLLVHHPNMVQLALQKYSEQHSVYKDSIHFKRLKSPVCENNSPLIKPGIYKGTYSAHGIELILVEVSESKITATKITGDPNIPAGQMTFDVDLNKPIDEDDEAEEGEEAEAEEREIVEDQRPMLRPQEKPFRLPRHYTSDFDGYPATYLSRYHGVGQVAYHNYTNPSLTPGEMVIFNQELVGFLWHELLAFSVFSRCTEDYLHNQ